MIGLPPPSARTWILVENPPCERPSASPPRRRRPGEMRRRRAGGRGRWSRPRSAGPSRSGLPRPPRPATRRAPGPTPRPRASGRTGSRRCRPGRSARAGPATARPCAAPTDAVDYAPVVVVRPPGARPLRWQQRLQPPPLPIGEVQASHPRQIGSSGPAATRSQTRPRRRRAGRRHPVRKVPLRRRLRSSEARPRPSARADQE